VCSPHRFHSEFAYLPGSARRWRALRGGSPRETGVNAVTLHLSAPNIQSLMVRSAAADRYTRAAVLLHGFHSRILLICLERTPLACLRGGLAAKNRVSIAASSHLSAPGDSIADGAVPSADRYTRAACVPHRFHSRICLSVSSRVRSFAQSIFAPILVVNGQQAAVAR